MSTNFSFHALALSLMTSALLVACSSKSPEALVASAKDYLAKNQEKAAVIELKNALSKNPDLAEARYLLGKSLLDDWDSAGAEIELRKAVALHYDENKVEPLLARTLLIEGQAKKVIDEMSHLQLTDAEAQSTLQTSLGMAYAVQGDLNKARDSIAQALRTSPDNDQALLAQARLKLDDKDVNGALASLDRAVAKNPGNYEAWTMKGDLLSFQGQGDAAVTAYRKALASKSDYAPAHSALAMYYLRQGKLDEAGKQIEVMKKVLPNRVQTVRMETIYEYQKKDFSRARDLVLKLLNAVPNDTQALVLAGTIHLQLNAILQAESYLNKAHELSPDAIEPRKLLAELYLRSGLPAKALSLIEPFLKDNKDPQLLSLAGAAYLQSGNAQKANEYFNLASVLAPKDNSVKIKAALSEMALGQKDAGFAALEQVASVDKGTTADMAMISAAIRQKEFDKAFLAIDTLEKKQPGTPVPSTLRGTTMITKGDFIAARRYFEQALTIKPTFFPAVTSLATLDFLENKPEAAKQRYQTLLKSDPKNSAALLALAGLEGQTGGAPMKVFDLLVKAVKADPKDIRARLAYINYCLSTKDAKRAVEASQDAVATIPDHPELLDLLARSQLAAGQTNEAISTYNKVLALLPNSPQARLRMADLQMAAKQKDDALQSLKKAIEIQNDFLPAQRGLVIFYLSDKKYNEAFAIARDVQKQRPKENAGYQLEGDIDAIRKEWSAAADVYRAGLNRQPDSELAIKTNAALVQAGKVAEAGKFQTSWLQSHQDDAVFTSYAAQNALNGGNYSAAIKLYQSILRVRPNDWKIMNNMAWALGQVNDPKAISYAEQANKLVPKRPEIMDTLAMLSAKKGDTTRALSLLKEAFSLAPAANDIRFDLAKVQLQAGKRDEALANLRELEKLGNKFSGYAEVRKLLGNTSGS
ncbi:MAG: PEP-CTERM system TPR-repeat protein PrsT [Parasulfuritortus sp.]|jgi:putative PEP-CTERM system TPR-repeat lipoprotein|nr:PEP-CTERM system TPR-repeat protein PrsT [Parasulfuritortus sp.]